MKRIKFMYDEPMIGSIEIEGPTENFDEEMILKHIYQEWPEAINVEILETEELDG